jgi:hypothetical protein
MLRTLATALAMLVLSITWTQSAHAEDTALRDITITSLATDVKDDDDAFEIIYSRMDETATAAVFFGMVGAIASSAIHANEDDAREDPLRATADSLELRRLIHEALNARLQARGAVPLAPPESASHTLVVDIGEWGLVRRAQLPDTTMRAYLKLNISLVDPRGRRVWGPQREHSVGQLNGDLSEFTPEVFRAEMEALAARAGNSVANKIIYRQ